MLSSVDDGEGGGQWTRYNAVDVVEVNPDAFFFSDPVLWA